MGSIGQPKLLTTREAAELLHLAEDTLVVWRCTKRVTLPFIRLGRAIRYRESDIHAFIESNICATRAEEI
jgi:excisionase family DNA binding protein